MLYLFISVQTIENLREQEIMSSNNIPRVVDGAFPNWVINLGSVIDPNYSIRPRQGHAGNLNSIVAHAMSQPARPPATPNDIPPFINHGNPHRNVRHYHSFNCDNPNPANSSQTNMANDDESDVDMNDNTNNNLGNANTHQSSTVHQNPNPNNNNNNRPSRATSLGIPRLIDRSNNNDSVSNVATNVQQNINDQMSQNIVSVPSAVTTTQAQQPATSSQNNSIMNNMQSSASSLSNPLMNVGHIPQQIVNSFIAIPAQPVQTVSIPNIVLFSNINNTRQGMNNGNNLVINATNLSQIPAIYNISGANVMNSNTNNMITNNTNSVRTLHCRRDCILGTPNPNIRSYTCTHHGIMYVVVFCLDKVFVSCLIDKI